MRIPRILLVLVCLLAPVLDAQAPVPAERDVVLRDFRFAAGERLPELRVHVRTYGALRKDSQGRALNAVLILHGTTGSGAQFLRPEFAGELFGPGQLLDASRYFIVLPDGIGHGRSSKPSDGLRARFPRYGYLDMVEAQRRMLAEGFGVDHLRLVMGTSMGGMHTWLWGQLHPEAMDALMPLASLPTQIAGRNRVWRRVLIDAIRCDPAWKGGEYTAQPPSLRTAAGFLWLMGSNPPLRQKETPTLAGTDAAFDAFVANYLRHGDANDVLYAVEASRDYDPGPGLERIRAPLLAVNSADDLINPPELGILEQEIHRVPHGRMVLLPFSANTRGHGSHTLAALWKEHLATLLRDSESTPQALRALCCNIRTAYADREDAKLGNAWPQRKPLALRLLREVDPDLIGIQEATDGQVQDLAPGFKVLHREELALLYRPERLEALEGGVLALGTFGNADPWGDRYVQWQVFQAKAGGWKVLVLNTHLSVKGDHTPQARQVLDLAEEKGRGLPILVMGDFNFDAGGMLAARGFQDPIPDHQGTFHAFKGGRAGERIDFFGLRKLEALDWGIPTFSEKAGTFTVYPTDHYPLWVKVVPAP